MLLEELFKDVALRVPDAPLALVENAVRSALGRFFRDSTSWRKRFSTVALVANQSDYDLRALGVDPICAVTDLRLLSSQVPILPAIESKMNLLSPTWRVDKATYPIRYLCPEEPGMVKLWPTPTLGDDFLDVELAFYPGRSTYEIPDWIGEMYFDGLVQGACGVLYRLPRRVWTNPSEAREAEDRLRSSALDAQARVSKSNTRSIVIARTTGFEEI